MLFNHRQTRPPPVRPFGNARWVLTIGLILAVLAAGGAGAGQAEAWAPDSAGDVSTGDQGHPPATSGGTSCDNLFKSGLGGPAYARSSAGPGNGSQAAATATAYWFGTGRWKVAPQRLCINTSEGPFWFHVSEVLSAQP